MSGPRDKQIVISLGLTKAGKRQGAAESVILGFQPAVQLTKRWKSLVSPSATFVSSSAKWRNLFNECLCALGMDKYHFRPYSLRRGGATYWFAKRQSMDRLLIQGRWASQKTARIYLNEGLSMLTSMDLPVSHPNIKPFLHIFEHTLSSSNFTTLEPPGGRRGGRGMKGPKAMKRQKVFASNSPFFISDHIKP